MLRELTDVEKSVLKVLLSEPFPGRDALDQQVPYVRTTGLSCTCGCPSIALEVSPPGSPAAVTERVPVEAFGRDESGNLVGVLLFVDNGLMSELEFYSLVGDEAPAIPKLDSLRIAEWSEQQDGGRSLLNEPPP
jgi:hypothetical protein